MNSPGAEQHVGVFNTREGSWSSEAEMKYATDHGGIPGADIRSSGAGRGRVVRWHMSFVVMGVLGAVVVGVY